LTVLLLHTGCQSSADGELATLPFSPPETSEAAVRNGQADHKAGSRDDVTSTTTTYLPNIQSKHLFWVDKDCLVGLDPVVGEAFVVSTAGAASECSGNFCGVRDLLLQNGHLYFIYMNTVLLNNYSSGSTFAIPTLEAFDSKMACAHDKCHPRNLIFVESRLFFVYMDRVMIYYPAIGRTLFVPTTGALAECTGDWCWTRDTQYVKWGSCPNGPDGAFFFVTENSLLRYDLDAAASIRIYPPANNASSCKGTLCHLRDVRFFDGFLFFAYKDEIFQYDPLEDVNWVQPNQNESKIGSIRNPAKVGRVLSNQQGASWPGTGYDTAVKILGVTVPDATDPTVFRHHYQNAGNAWHHARHYEGSGEPLQAQVPTQPPPHHESGLAAEIGSIVGNVMHSLWHMLGFSGY
jgi:hypothetical protein